MSEKMLLFTVELQLMIVFFFKSPDYSPPINETQSEIKDQSFLIIKQPRKAASDHDKEAGSVECLVFFLVIDVDYVD